MIIEQATDRDIARLHLKARIPFPWEGLVAKKGETIMGIGGVYVEPSGRIMGFMDLHPGLRTPILFRNVLRYINELKDRGIDEISVKCETRFNRAEAFLKRLGFEATGTYEDEMEVWTWRH